jgi:sRNA-binding carbon storage regulator CsrA
MAFKLSRRTGDAFEINGVLIEIVDIQESKVIFSITSDEPVHVRYKDLTRRAKSEADGCSQSGQS